MSLVPAFEISIWNAWIFILPFLLVTYGISYLVVNRKSALFSWPEYNKQEKPLLGIMMVCWIASWIYSIFVPLKLGTPWFYVGLPIYLGGLIFDVLATITFARTSPDKPNTEGIYQISRHPMYLGFVLIYVGVGIASGQNNLRNDEKQHHLPPAKPVAKPPGEKQRQNRRKPAHHQHEANERRIHLKPATRALPSQIHGEIGKVDVSCKR